jgi:hypothetical protein
MRRMKKSQNVQVQLLAAVAALTLSGCSSPGPREVRRCVDQNGNVLPERECERRSGGGGYYGRGYYYPRYVYGGSVDNGRVRNFRTTASPGAHVVTQSGRTITRGGLGGRGFSGFG